MIRGAPARAPLAPRSLNQGSTLGAGASDAAEVARFAIRSGKYPHRLSLYERPPTEEITLDEFETWAIDRLKLLADIEAAQARNKTPEELKTIITARAKIHLSLSSNSAKGVDVELERRKDHYSHFVLRLAFCRSEELRQRFLRAERTLFRVRFETDDLEDRRRFVDSLNFGWEVVSPEEKERFRKELATASFLKEDKIAAESFFKVDWTRVSDLVSSRRVFVFGGMAFVPAKEELSLLMTEFTARLGRGLEMTAKALPRLDEDDRLLPVLEHLSMGFMAGITSSYTTAADGDGEKITAEMIPELAMTSFPFCMRSLQDALKLNKHLKHEGRQQYQLFLKGIGMSVEEALVFWRRSFSVMTDDKFNKEHKYNIRHSYGLEGSRKNYSPKSCMQIITGSQPGPGQSHGCPFRHYSETNLSAALSTTYRLSSLDQKEILAAVKNKHFHVACTRLFEIQHASNGVVKGEGLGKGDMVDHPNKFFERSRKVIMGETDDDQVKAEGGVNSDKGAKMEVDT